jgi:hypothetical protein
MKQRKEKQKKEKMSYPHCITASYNPLICSISVVEKIGESR